MPRICRAFPVLPGKRQQLDEFIARLKEDKSRTDAFYAAYNTRRESVHLQKLGSTEIIIACLDIDEVPAAAEAYRIAEDQYHRWFKQQVTEISGVDLNVHPMGPESACIFDWQSSKS